MKFWTSASTFTFNTAVQSFGKKLQLTIIYHQTKFGCKRISSSVVMVEIIILFDEPSVCDLHLLKLVIQSFCMTVDTQVHVTHHHTKFGKEKVQWLRRYHLDEHWFFLKIIAVTLTLNTAIQSFYKTHSYDNVPTRFGCKSISSSDIV